MALHINSVLFLFFVLFFNCTIQQQSPSPEPENIPNPFGSTIPSPSSEISEPEPSPSPLPSPSSGNSVPQPSPSSSGSGSTVPAPSAVSSLCCVGSPLTRICPDGITSVEAACDNSTCKWFFSVACPVAPSYQVCQCPIYNLPRCGNATVTCLPQGSSCGYVCDCEGVCSGSAPCTNAYCGFNKTSSSCQWVDSKCTFPVSNYVNCSAPGACNQSSNCSNGVAPKCLRAGLTCANVCPAPLGTGVTIDCTNQCLGTPSCNGAQCKLVPVNLQNFQTLTNLTNFTSLANLTSNSTIPAQCQWSCPDICSTWCSGYQCPTGTSLVSCEQSPYDVSSCLPVCASPVCNKQCLELQCGPGSTAMCNGNNSCSFSCPSSSCTNPCAPNCAPICSLGGTKKPCANSTCSFPAGYNTTYANLYNPKSLSNCEWIPSNDNGICVAEPPKKCVGTPLCSYSVCSTDLNGTNFWDNTICVKDCSLLSQSQCPGGLQQCTAGPGFCLLVGSTCSWTCPIDPCLNASGFSLCQNPAPTVAPFSGCLSWNARCLVSNTTAVPPVCSWDVQCNQVNQSLTGPCLTSDCGSFPNTTCPGQAMGNCLRLSGTGPCQWVYSCPPSSSPCTDADCPALETVETNFTTVCGLNPTAKAMCVRNARGYCERTSACYLVYNPPACQTSPCGDICYDPRWTNGELVAPDFFNASLLQQNPANCSLCARRCSTYLFCGRPSNHPICQFSQSNAYTQCMAKCNSTLFLLPNSLLNNTSPSAQCSGNDPCACNYSACTFVMANYSYGVYAECLSNQQANFALSLPGVQTVYSRVSLPPYCQVLQYFGNTNNNISASAAQSLIWMIDNLNVNSLQQSLLDQLTPLTLGSFTNFFPQINNILVPSELNGSFINSSSPLVNIGALITLSGANPPNQTDLNNWCWFILHNIIANSLNLSDSEVGPCVLTPISSNWNANNTSNGFTGTYLLTSFLNPNMYPSLANLTNWEPQPSGWNVTYTPLPLETNGTTSSNSTWTPGSPSPSKEPSTGPAHAPGTVVKPPLSPVNLTQPGVTVPTIPPPSGSGSNTPSVGSTFTWSMSVFLLVLGGLFLNL